MMMLLSRYPAERYAPPPLGTAPLGMFLGHRIRVEYFYKSRRLCTVYVAQSTCHHCVRWTPDCTKRRIGRDARGGGGVASARVMGPRI